MLKQSLRSVIGTILLYDQLGRGQIMDAAQKLLRTSALLFAIALLMAAPGWSQTLVRLRHLLRSGTSGSANANVTSSAAGTTEITYTIATAYPSDTPSSEARLVLRRNRHPGHSVFSASETIRHGVNCGATGNVTLTPSSPSAGTGRSRLPLPTTAPAAAGVAAPVMPSRPPRTPSLSAAPELRLSPALSHLRTSAPIRSP